jgi:endoglucanase
MVMEIKRTSICRQSVASAVAVLVGGLAAAGCIPKTRPSGGQNYYTTASPQAQATVGDNLTLPSPPPPPPAAPVPSVKNTGNPNIDRFLQLWTDLHDMSNGYFSPEGVPYHSPETLIVEAPDYGHTTTSEAYSYYIWLEAMFGKVTKDWSHLDRAWKSLEYYIIPTHLDQPTNHAYTPTKTATFAAEQDTPQQYPVPLEGSVTVGIDPIGKELRDAYGNSDVYAMHWLLDVDNWYGFGKRSDGRSHVVYFNTFQRGPDESVWETIPQPCWDDFTFGGQFGYLDLFVKDPHPAKQWKYSNAPDADARAVQAVYWAKKWADEQGGSAMVDAITPKAAMMGDYIRYALFDKYFKKIGCQDRGCPKGTGYDAAHYLLSWFFAWGGSIPGGSVWAWRIGSSHNHTGYQNPLAAHALANEPSMRPRSANGARDWATSLVRQLEFYRWAQSADGGFAGGATNSWNGRYDKHPTGTKTFYGMGYTVAPVFVDPPSNEWFGFQVWSVQRVAEYYYVTGDPKAEMMLDRWVDWVKKNTKVNKDGTWQIPATLEWTGAPQLDWNEANQNWDPKDKNYNQTLHVRVKDHSDDVGTTAGLVHTLAFYAKKKNDNESKNLCRELLDRMWAKYRDKKGISSLEVRKDFKRFADKVYVPAGWQGKMPNGDPINSDSTFFSIRSKYKSDPDYPKLEAALKGGKPVAQHYHRFWAQTHIALAYATYGWLFPKN